MWTPDKKVGDEVYFRSGGWSGEWSKHRIIRETPTQFVLSGPVEIRVRKKSGHGVGEIGGYAIDIDSEEAEQVSRRINERNVEYKARKIAWRIERMMKNHESREWLVTHIGPLLPKEGE